MKMFPSFARIGWGSKREDRLLALQHHFDRQRKVTKARRDPPRAGHTKRYERWHYAPPATRAFCLIVARSRQAQAVYGGPCQAGLCRPLELILLWRKDSHEVTPVCAAVLKKGFWCLRSLRLRSSKSSPVEVE